VSSPDHADRPRIAIVLIGAALLLWPTPKFGRRVWCRPSLIERSVDGHVVT